MSDIDQNKIIEMYNFLKTNSKNKQFGLRDGYLYSGLKRTIVFEMFLDYKTLTLKYTVPLISDELIKALNIIIKKLNPDFEHQPRIKGYRYETWDLDISNLTYQEVIDIIEKYEKQYT